MKKNHSFYINRIVSLAIAAVMIFTLSSCSSTEKSGSKWRPSDRISSCTVATCGDYELLWDDAAACIVMRSVSTGAVYSDILYKEYQSGNSSANTSSSVIISIIDTSTLAIDTLNSYSEIEANGKIYSEKIKNGIRVTYSFNSYSIAVPVDYTVREDSLCVSINGADVIEGGDRYKLVSVSVAPYLCHASNFDTNSYLFVPSGSGALMYTGENADDTRTYSGEVYGADATRRVAEYFTDNEAVRMPVFGVKDGDGAILGIIEEGAGSAVIEAKAGYSRAGYSNVYPTFYMRGYDVFRFGSYATGNDITTRVSDDISTNTVSVGYYPLKDEDADYNGMADRYRKYLIDNEMLDNAKIETSSYSVTLLGGTKVSSSFIGFPVNKLKSLTTFKQAQNIITDLTETNGTSPTIRLSGFSDGGISFGEIAGGSRFPSVYGKKKDYKSLIRSCLTSEIPIFTDFEVIRYTNSGNGFFYSNDCAKTAIHYAATQYAYTPLRLFDETKDYRILKRDELEKSVNKALKKAEYYDTTGISFDSLGSVAYSDFSNPIYACKYGIERQVVKLIRSVKKSKHIVSVSGGNDYAACAADVVFDVPSGNGDYNSLDEEIPFYQMVFHSYRPMYSTAINMSDNSNRAVMLAACGGMGLGFVLTNDYLNNSIDVENEKLYSTKYSDNAKRINDLLLGSGYAEFYSSIADSAIINYEILSDAVSKTEFSNGVIVYANHSNTNVNSPAGELEAYGFKVEQGVAS